MGEDDKRQIVIVLVEVDVFQVNVKAHAKESRKNFFVCRRINPHVNELMKYLKKVIY